MRQCFIVLTACHLGIDCCDECGSTDIRQASIEEWEKLYREKYNKSFINK
jgi:hypothetical protein